MSFQYDPYAFQWTVSWNPYLSVVWGYNYLDMAYINTPDFALQFYDLYGGSIGRFVQSWIDMSIWSENIGGYDPFLIDYIQAFNILPKQAEASGWLDGFSGLLLGTYMYMTNLLTAPLKLLKIIAQGSGYYNVSGPAILQYGFYGSKLSGVSSKTLGKSYFDTNFANSVSCAVAGTVAFDLFFSLYDGRLTDEDLVEMFADVTSNSIIAGLSTFAVSILISSQPEIGASLILLASLGITTGLNAFFEFFPIIPGYSFNSAMSRLYSELIWTDFSYTLFAAPWIQPDNQLSIPILSYLYQNIPGGYSSVIYDNGYFNIFFTE